MPQIGCRVGGRSRFPTLMLFVDFCEQFRFGWLIVFYKLCDLGTAGKAHEHDQTAEQRYEFGIHGVALLLILILPFPIFLPDAV